MNEIELGLELAAYGLAGVFVVLALFYCLINALKKMFPVKKD